LEERIVELENNKSNDDLKKMQGVVEYLQERRNSLEYGPQE
jgi:hypothetical protein